MNNEITSADIIDLRDDALEARNFDMAAVCTHALGKSYEVRTPRASITSTRSRRRCGPRSA
jgi:hypothetical protein